MVSSAWHIYNTTPAPKTQEMRKHHDSEIIRARGPEHQVGESAMCMAEKMQERKFNSIVRSLEYGLEFARED